MRLTNPAMFEIAAQRRCLAAIFPELGGVWSSPCRPGVVTSSEPVAWEGSVYPNAVNDPAVTAQILAAPLDDYRLELTFLVTADSTLNAYIAGASGFGIYYTVAGQIQLINYSVGTTGSTSFYTFTPELNREYTAVLDRVGGTMHIILDGETVRSTSGTNADWSTGSITMIRRTGVLRSCRWTNLTTEAVIFDYPESPSVRQNLLFRYNTSTQNNCFEVQDATGGNSYLATKLDLSGYAGDLTLFADVEIPYRPPGDATAYTWHLAAQGYQLASASGFQFRLRGLYTSAGGIYVSFEASDGTTTAGATSLGNYVWPEAGRHVLTGVYSQSQRRIRLYIDGVLITETALAAAFLERLNPTLSTVNQARYFGSFQSGPGTQYPRDQKIYGLMLFDGTMSASEIRAISNLMRAS